MQRLPKVEPRVSVDGSTSLPYMPPRGKFNGGQKHP